MKKTYVLDASALFIFLQEKEKSAAHKVGELLKAATRGHAEVMMSAANSGEVYGRILREHGQERASGTMSAIAPLPIRIMDVTQPRAFRAAEIKARHKLYYVDSFAAALAFEHKATLVTSDSDFRKLGNSVSILWLKS